MYWPGENNISLESNYQNNESDNIAKLDHKSDNIAKLGNESDNIAKLDHESDNIAKLGNESKTPSTKMKCETSQLHSGGINR